MSTSITISVNSIKDLLAQLSKKATEIKDSKEKQIEKLRTEHLRENLVLVLGAGVSLDSGLLSWNSLLQKLLISTVKEQFSRDDEASTVLAKLFNKIFEPTPLIAGRYLDDFYGKSSTGDHYAFEKAVRDSLYEQFDDTMESQIIVEIRKLCLAVGKCPNLKGIIT